MYAIYTSRFYVLNVHRTTFKRLNSYLILEKSILQLDHLIPREKVSSLCISPIVSYKNTATLIIIVNHWPLTISVSELLPLQTLRYCGILSNIALIVGIDVTGYHPHIETAKSFLYSKFLILFK